MAKKVRVKAVVRIVSSIKGKVLSPVENYEAIFDVRKTDEDASDVVMKAVCNANIRGSFVEAFRERLRNNSQLKHEIGGTRWSVDLLNMEYEILEKTNA